MKKIKESNLDSNQEPITKGLHKNCFRKGFELKQRGQILRVSNAFIKIVGLIIIIITISCSPQSKESYLDEFQLFIAEINRESDKYTALDWEKADEKFEKYTGEWYLKFEDDFTWQEQLKLTQYKYQYNLKKITENTSDYFINFNEEYYSQIKQQIKYYNENEMNEVIKEIIKQAEEDGKSATKMVEDILKELDIEVKDFQNK